MKAKNIVFLGLIIGLLLSCEKNKESGPQTYSFSGKAQKGPFVTGTNVTLNELNSSLGQTGKSFTSSIYNDDGSFSLNNIELNSNYSLITANGFYFNEIYGELSPATLSLQALIDLTDKETVNINILTHLIKGRIEKLASEGLTFQEAYAQSKSELLSFFGVTASFDIDFESLDISINNDYNGFLLAVSIIVQRYTYSVSEKPALTAELTQLLSIMSSDFQDNGVINNQGIIDTLLHNISYANLSDIKDNIEKRYSDLGLTMDIPDFQKYINLFQEKYCDIVYTDFSYPNLAASEPFYPNDLTLNFLNTNDTIYTCCGFSIAAVVPINSSLKVKFINVSNLNCWPFVYGWKFEGDYPNGFTLISQRQNQLMTGLLYTDNPGSAIIEFYENDMETPCRIKNVKWIQP